MRISDETKVGLFAVATLVVLFVGVKFMKGRDIFSSANTYYAYYDDINGIQESNPIVVNGHRIGRVYDIRLEQENGNRVLVVLSVQGDLKLPLGTKARIIDLDILGQKAIELVLSESNQYHESKDTLIGESSPGMIGEMIEPYIEKVKETIAKLQESLDDGDGTDLKTTIANLNETIVNIKEITEDLNDANLASRLSLIVGHVEAITRTLKENEENIHAILTNLNTVSDSLAAAHIKQTIDESYAVLEQVNLITQKINSGEGSLGMLVNDDVLYKNLEKTSNDLDKLILDLKEHPGRYVHFSLFGRKDKEAKEKKDNPESNPLN
ncbi:MlaD family protein [Bacteroidota bacterium]